MSSTTPLATPASPAGSVLPEPLRLWYTRCPVPTASGLALDFGWLAEEFERDDILLRSVRAADDRALRDAHFEHTLPNMFREGGNVPALWAKGRGHETVLLALTWVYEAQLILARRDDAFPLDALAGKRIGVPRYSGSKVDFTRAMTLRGISSALATVGLSLSDIMLVDVENGEIDLREDPRVGHPVRADVHALLEGQVDAIYFKGPNAIRALDTYPLRAVADLGANPDRRLVINNGNPRTLTVSRDLVQSRPGVVARYVDVLIRAARWADSHESEVTRVVAAETGNSVERVERAYGHDLHRSLHLGVDAELVAYLADQYEFLRVSNLIEKPFDVRQWVEPAIFAEAKRLADAAPALEVR